MAKYSIFYLISARVEQAPAGSLFCVVDFLDLASQKAVSKSLLRLEKQHSLIKLYNGLFYKPDVNNQEPPIREVAKAIARSNGWRSVPTDDTALFYIGFQKEEPAEWHFISNGTNRVYTYQGKQIVFTHAAGRFVTLLSPVTATWVQALKHLTPKALTAPLMEKLKSLISPEVKSMLSEEFRLCPAWIASTLLILCSSAILKQ